MSLSHGTTDPFVVKDYKKGLFFTPSLTQKSKYISTTKKRKKLRVRDKKRPVFWSLWLRRGSGGRQKCKRLRCFFFISYAFFGVFQNDPRPPKYALELRDYVKTYSFLSISLPHINTQLGGKLSFARHQISKSVKKKRKLQDGPHQNETKAPNAPHQVIYKIQDPKEEVNLKDGYNIKAATALGVIHIICGLIRVYR